MIRDLERVKKMHLAAIEVIELAQYAEDRINARERYNNDLRYNQNFPDNVAQNKERNKTTKKAQKRILKSHDVILADLFNASNVY